MNTAPAIKLTQEGAMSVVEAAVKRAQAMKVMVSIAVVDDGGHLMAFVRTEGARLHTVAIAQAKARSAALTRSPTGKKTSSGRDMDDHLAMAITLAAGPGSIVTIQGGVPISVDGHFIGAVGVSGAKSEEDREIAETGIASLGK